MGLLGPVPVMLNYIGGHPELDKARPVTIRRDGEYFEIKYGFSGSLKINKSDINSVKLDRASRRSAGGAAAGAIIGGVLTGGIGALAGAAFGGRKKDDSILVVSTKYNGFDIDIIFGGKDVEKKYSKFMALFK